MKIFTQIFLLAALSAAFSSCNKEQEGDPYMLFEIHGKVIDGEGNPIEGIHVYSGTSEVQKTNKNGNFVFYGRSVPTTYVILTFEDKDGGDNGGEFVKTSMDILVHEKTPGSEAGNFKGTYFAGDVEVIMLAKEENMSPLPDSGLIPL